MLHGEGNEKGKNNNNNNNNKTKQNKTIGLKQKKKKTFPLAAHVFCTFFAVVFDYYNVKLPILVTRFIEEMSHEKSTMLKIKPRWCLVSV